ncbi:hypothetical protein GCM10010266_64220 [Streptomyces griseomycini]|nr:hypothetical protein GCM10010266_64220 [Streptomyces griseomycini]
MLPEQRPDPPGPVIAERIGRTRSMTAGSVRWLENAASGGHDLAALQQHRTAVTDEPAPLVAVSRSGTGRSGLRAAYGPGGLLGARRRG